MMNIRVRQLKLAFIGFFLFLNPFRFEGGIFQLKVSFHSSKNQLLFLDIKQSFNEAIVQIHFILNIQNQYLNPKNDYEAITQMQAFEEMRYCSNILMMIVLINTTRITLIIFKYIINSMGNNLPQFHQKTALSNSDLRQVELIDNNQQMQATFLVKSQEKQKWVEKLKKIVSIDDQVILLPKSYKEIKKLVCNENMVLQICYDCYPTTLSDQIGRRKKANNHFNQSQIWYLLYSLISAAHTLERLNQRIGDIKPENIFLNQDGQIKVSCLLTWPQFKTNYEKYVFDSNENVYISPEEGKAETYINKFQAESFSIGATVLEAMTLEKVVYFNNKIKRLEYPGIANLFLNWGSYKFQVKDEKGNQMNIFKPYSQCLKSILEGFCELDPEKRLSSAQIHEWLQPFKERINELKSFDPGFPPQKKKGNQTNRKIRIPRQLFERKEEDSSTFKKSNVISLNPRPYNQGVSQKKINRIASVSPMMKSQQQFQNNLTINDEHKLKTLIPPQIIQKPDIQYNHQSHPHKVNLYQPQFVTSPSTHLHFPTQPSREYIPKERSLERNGSQSKTKQFLQQIDQRIRQLRKIRS